MNLYRAIGSIGGLTMVSRVLGFARDMVGSRILGAGAANDAFFFAFLLPNIFRKLFGEGAFSSGFVPLFSKRLNSDGGTRDAEQFSNEILAVFMPTLLLVTLVFEIAMPAFLLLVASDYQSTPGKFELTVELTRITFPYLVFISLVALLAGVLNSLTRFAVAAFAPALLNITLIAALLIVPTGGAPTVRAMAIAVLVGGVLQFALCWWAVRKAGIKLRFGWPKMTPGVRELVVLVLPATFAAGVYQISQLFYGYFSTQLGDGALTLLNYADRLNQLPLSIVGTALGVAILPSISRSIDRGDAAEASDLQAKAFDLSMLLSLPAALALAVASFPIVAGIFVGGRFTLEDAAVAARILTILALGLPAYVLVKVLTPGFYARADVRTPVRIAMAILVGSIAANFLLIPVLGIYSLAVTTAGGAWLNFLALFVILHRRGHFRVPGWLWSRLSRQIVAALAMAAALYFLQAPLSALVGDSGFGRFLSVGILVGIGMTVYFVLAWVLGGFDREAIMALRRKKPAGGTTA